MFPTGKQGVTLLELTFVALLLGVMASIVWPDLRRYGRTTLSRAESDDIQARLREARLQAMLDGHEVSVDLSDLHHHRASAPRARFYPDGSADSLLIAPVVARGQAEISIDASGRITLISSS